MRPDDRHESAWTKWGGALAIWVVSLLVAGTSFAIAVESPAPRAVTPVTPRPSASAGDSAVATIRSLTASPAHPGVGRTSTWTAVASGGRRPLQYKFYRQDKGTWNTVQQYGDSNTYRWTPSNSDLGVHRVVVWVRSAGSTAEWEAWTQTEDVYIGATVLSLTSSRTSPRVGLSMTWTASAVGSPPPLEYRFWRQDAGTWVVVRDYGPANTWSWVPGSQDAGKHAVIVWVRAAGSKNPQDSWSQSPPFAVAP